MRKNKSMCVTSQWLLLMLFALSTGRSLDAAVVSIRRFRLRNRLSVRVITHRGTKKRSELQEVADKFSRTITYNLEMVGLIAAKNVDAIQGMSQNSFGASVVLCASATGQKLLPFVVFAWKRERMIEWIKEVWKPSVTAPRLLLLDSLKSHRINSFYPGVEGALRDTKRKSIYLWEKKRARIEEICTTTKGGQLKIVRDLGTATVLSHDAERKIVQWIGEMREQGAPVSAFMLKSKALDIAAEEGLPRDAFKTSTPQQRSSSYCDALSQPSESTAVANELLALGQLDRVFREVQEGSDVVENAVVGVFEVLADDEEE
ncbi:hypothetical protein PC122_g18738 [Phytophthora cactorum]|nr:hypothetical protein PC122_g18738 [Phytophthora cactorum]